MATQWIPKIPQGHPVNRPLQPIMCTLERAPRPQPGASVTFLTVPVEIRFHIYHHLFRGASVTFDAIEKTEITRFRRLKSLRKRTGKYCSTMMTTHGWLRGRIRDYWMRKMTKRYWLKPDIDFCYEILFTCRACYFEASTCLYDATAFNYTEYPRCSGVSRLHRYYYFWQIRHLCVDFSPPWNGLVARFFPNFKTVTMSTPLRIVEADEDDYFGSSKITRKQVLRDANESFANIDGMTSGGLTAFQNVVIKQLDGCRLFHKVRYEAWSSISDELIDILVSAVLAIEEFPGHCANLRWNRPPWSKQEQTRSS